jgi:cellulase
MLRAYLLLFIFNTTGTNAWTVRCYQITVTGTGTASPAGVVFPGAYSATDPGIQINIYQALSTYVAPGPAVISGGTEAIAGKAGSAVTATAGAPAATSVTKAVVSSAAATTKTAVSSAAATTKAPASSTLVTAVKPTTSAGTGACSAVKQYEQCGGSGFAGCTTCAGSAKCVVLNSYYSQCQ